MNVKGMKFVITGSGAGIGAGTALRAASYGASVMVSDINDENGQEVVESIKAEGGTAYYQHCDVTDESQVLELMSQAQQKMGGIDVSSETRKDLTLIASRGSILDSSDMSVAEQMRNTAVEVFRMTASTREFQRA